MEVFQRCIEERDKDLAGEVLDADYTLQLVQPVGAEVTRDKWLAMLPDYVVHDYRVDTEIVNEDGDCAITLQRASMRATVLGEDRSGVFIITDVWRKRDGQWRIWRRHSTPLSAAALPDG